VSCLQKFHISKFKLLLLIFIGLTIAFTLFLNFFLSSQKNQLLSKIRANEFPEISFRAGNIIYLPPNFLILKDAELLLKDKAILSLPAARMNFSLLQLIRERNLYITAAYFHSPKTKDYEFLYFLKNNFNTIVDFLMHLALRDIRVSVRNANFYVSDAGNPNNFLSLDSVLTIKGNDISCAGSAGYKNEPVNYSLRGFFTGRGFSIDKLEIGKDNFYSHLTGNVKEKTLTLKGFIFINTAFRESHVKRASFLAGKPVDFQLPKADLNIFDIDAEIGFDMPDIAVKKLSFLLNKNSFNFKGKINLSGNPSLEAQAIYVPVEPREFENLKKLSLYAKGLVKKSGFEGVAKLNLELENKQATYSLLDKIEVDCLGFGLNFENRRIKLTAAKISGQRKTKDNTQSVELKDFRGVLRPREKNLQLADFRCGFYGGHLLGGGLINLFAKPAKVSLLMRIKDADANKLDGLLVHFSKVFGNFSSDMRFNNYPESNLSGTMNIRNGYLNDFEFFKWFSDVFDLPFLKRVNFKKAGSGFIVNRQGAALRKINLDSKDLKGSGDFNLGRGDIVSSKISLVLTRDLLEKSSKLSPLLRILNEDLSSLAFNFQMSGFLRSMNFKWLESDFKNELQDLLPDRMERRIEKSVEEIITSISPQ
jgi:hypothetical protein